MLALSPTVAMFSRLQMVLQHFSCLSGLTVNFDKSVLMHTQMDPLFCNHPAVSIYKHASLRDGFTYLGTKLGVNKVLQSNFFVHEQLMESVLKK